jgi:predicted dehydrogenase
LLVQYRSGDMLAPMLDRTEALYASTRHFLDSIKTGTTPLSDGRFARDIIELLEAADQSLKLGGQRVELPPLVSHAAAAE